jgi:RHS repeat-associated protein
MKDGTTGDAGDIYTGLDRFGRLAETLWKTNSTTLIQTKYGRNRVGGVVWQYNVKAHASSAATQDHYYWYDGLQQVTRHDRGTLVPSFGPPYTGIASANRQQQERFTFDETGNWTSENTQNPALAQTRTHNPANQITSISGPSGAVQPAYDPAGNMTVMPSTQDWSVGDELTWDAWNRLTRVRPASSSSSSSSLSSSESSSSSSQSSSSSENSSSSSSESHSSSGSSSSSAPSGEITYQYDARTRRTRKTNTAGSIDYYYDKQWRAIEERVGSSVSAEYVWSPLDRWTLIRRDRGGEEHYVLKDYLDPSAIIDTSANVIERFGYDAFGSVRFMDDSFAPQAGSAADWNFLFHAEFLDNDSGLYNYGYRYYNPQLGRWPSRDLIGERGGLNLYAFVRNNGISWVDRLGLKGEASSGSYDDCGCDRKAINLKIKEMSLKAGNESKEDLKNVPARIREVSAGREFGGRICCNKTNGEITATGPSRSTSGDDGWRKDIHKEWWKGQSIDIERDSPRCPEGTAEVARYHSHPSGSDRFSESDANSTALDKRPLGVGTPDGGVSIIEPILGDKETPYGKISGITIRIRGWGINDDGTLVPKEVVPINDSNWTTEREFESDPRLE